VTADPGASIERTRLAWRRTALSAAAVGLLACRPAFDPHAGPRAWTVAALAMACWVLMVALSYLRNHDLVGGQPRAGRRTIGAYALITVLFAALGGLVVTL
jgi:uncharacterized membrane protein YidH (DUF202 family)